LTTALQHSEKKKAAWSQQQPENYDSHLLHYIWRIQHIHHQIMITQQSRPKYIRHFISISHSSIQLYTNISPSSSSLTNITLWRRYSIHSATLTHCILSLNPHRYRIIFTFGN